MKLASYLEKNGISQAQFARLIGASPSAITRWLAGNRKPNLSQLQAIRRVTRGAVMPKDFYEMSCEPLDWRCRVRAWAIQNNTELRDIANAIDVTPATFSRYLTGAWKPSPSAARNIILATGINIPMEAFVEPRSNHNQPRSKTAGQRKAALHTKRARLHAR